MDYVQGLDPSKLTLALTALSFVLSPFAAPPYNLPILLFGTLAQQQEASDPQALQTVSFTGLLGASAIFDIIWMTRNDQNGFIRFLNIVLLIMKIPTFVAFGLALRQRGAQFSGLGIRGSDLGGATVWDSMPGGFGSGGNNGYQNVDEDRPAQYSNSRHPTSPPSMPVPQPPAPVAAAPPATGYQTV
ncbi:hypothetical protein B0H17DRAFT_1035999 [Mycena rosella]|uniref:Uncharacterized protein n=1 Tax=Mycena rosella TaxID=1033263 RepID=A0AAD7GVK6_MYCRO|nr:hypothetical protein B0H17DRAFT_1035999 [Mycena rosella]